MAEHMTSRATKKLPMGLEDNMRRWSGDHIVDPESVPGILFMNRAARNRQPAIIDLAPTVLNCLGVAIPESVEGSSLL